MIAFMVAAPHSGSGKTVVTSGLIALLKRKLGSVCAFKCGPDYIDTMFHSSVLGVESYNLDIFLAGKEGVKETFCRYSEGYPAAVAEGVMGMYDGLGGVETTASSWETAGVLGLPIILVLRARGASLSLAAEIKGFCEFRRPSNIAGVILNGCGPALFKTLKEALERESGVPVLGFLPQMEEAKFESRHLGLYTAGEVANVSGKLEKIADALEESLDFERLSDICTRDERSREAEAGGRLGITADLKSAKAPLLRARPKIAAAKDEAFCFLYRATLDALRDAGAEIAFFSPLRDKRLPEGACGLYLPGGYPELYAAELEQNEAMRSEIRRAVLGGLPTVAECGSFMYLGGRIEGEDGKLREMCGALLGEARKKDKLVRFGYAVLTAKEDSLLFRRGESFPVHEFHYWDSSENGRDFLAKKALGDRSWECGFATDTLYAGFPHLYLAGKPEAAERFVKKCAEYSMK